MNPRTFIIVAATILLAACAATYKSPGEFRANAEHKTSFVVNAEHKKMFTETLEFLRPCWEHNYGTANIRVTGDFVDHASQIFIGVYARSSPSIVLVIDMKTIGTSTEVVISSKQPAAGLAERIKLIATGVTQTCDKK